MHAALRPYFISSVALVGASVIAVTPVVTAPPDIHIANPAVQLTAAPMPIDFYGQVLERTLVNSVDLVREYVRTASTLIGIARTEPGLILRAVANPLFDLGLYAAAVQSFLRPLFSTVGATAVAARDIFGAVLNRSPIDLVNAIVDVPARIADGFLNGGETGIGLLSPFGGYLPGPLSFPAFAVFALEACDAGSRFSLNRKTDPVDATSTAAAPVNEPPTPGAATLTLDTTSSVTTDPTPAAHEPAPAEPSAAPQAEQGQDTAEAAIAKADTEIAKPYRAVRANHVKHAGGILDNIRKRVAERRTHADAGLSNASKHVRAGRTE